jgi:hypothetical protein
MINAHTILSEEVSEIPGEAFLLSCLQKPVSFSINSKTIKKGRLLLFRKTHYFIQITLQTDKNDKENIDLPYPFNIENYKYDGLLYYDYRVASLNVESLPFMPSKVSSIYFNKILEIACC